MSANFIDTVKAVTIMVDDIVSTSTTPFIFVDVEGINLSRHGSISILQLLIPPSPVIHLVDVFTLKDHAFDSLGSNGKTLKDILESNQYVKVFFDVRNDSDALFNHFRVDLKGVLDLQLVEYASRPAGGRLIKGLAKCISDDLGMGYTESRKWKEVKEAGQKLFAPERGGIYAVFNERPLPEAMRDYCVQDVMLLPKLLLGYANKLQPHMAVQVIDESRKRVLQSQAAHFNGQGRHMALAPSFRWTRASSTPVLESPFDTLCSPALRDCCTLDAPKPVPAAKETMHHDIPQQVEATSSAPETTSPAHDPTASTLQQLKRMQLIDDPGKRQTRGVESPNKYDRTKDEEDRLSDYRHSPSPDYYDQRSELDYTACSASDCGYCGRCGY